MSKKRHYNVADLSETDEATDNLDGCTIFKKYKFKTSSGQDAPDMNDKNTGTSSTVNKDSKKLAFASHEDTRKELPSGAVGNSAPGKSENVPLVPQQMQVGKTFAETFSFLKKTDMFQLPPEPKVEKIPSTKNTNSIIVSSRQRGNPILKHIRNIPWEYGEIIPDYEVGQTSCVLFLSLRYHNLNPDYIHERLKLLGSRYMLRVLLVLVDIQNTAHSLKELGKMAILANCTLILAWSAEEAGRYLETYKSYEHKPPDILQEKIEPDHLSKMQDVLTTVKSVNRTDVITLMSTFGSLKNIVNASKEEVCLCPGFGPQKAQRLHKILNETFKRSRISSALVNVDSNDQCKLKKPKDASPKKAVNIETKIIKPVDQEQNRSFEKNKKETDTSVIKETVPESSETSSMVETTSSLSTSPRKMSKSEAIYKSGLSRTRTKSGSTSNSTSFSPVKAKKADAAKNQAETESETNISQIEKNTLKSRAKLSTKNQTARQNIGPDSTKKDQGLKLDTKSCSSGNSSSKEVTISATQLSEKEYNDLLASDEEGDDESD